MVQVSVIVKHGAHHPKVAQFEFPLPLGCVECTNLTRFRCIPYRHSALRVSSRENEEIQNFCPLLCFNTRSRQRLCVYFCHEKRSSGVVYTAPMLIEALAAKRTYSDVTRRLVLAQHWSGNPPSPAHRARRQTVRSVTMTGLRV